MDAKTPDGQSALHLAALLSNVPAVITAFIEAGVDAGAMDESGLKPWDYAQSNEELKGTDAWWHLNDARF